MFKILIRPFKYWLGVNKLNKLVKTLILCVALMIVAYGVCFLLTNDTHAKIFFCESVVDNAIFCTMFIFVAWTTGMSC